MEEFFDESVTSKDLDRADLIYARHVIEHIFDFNGFFAGLNAMATPMADLILETPSLDYHAERGSIAPFHVEHIHVFSLRSLARLASSHGWGLQQAEVTAPGNLIASFKRGGVDCGRASAIPGRVAGCRWAPTGPTAESSRATVNSSSGVLEVQAPAWPVRLAVNRTSGPTAIPTRSERNMSA